MRLMAAVSILAGFSVSSLAAPVTPVSQERSVTHVAINSYPQVTSEIEAPGFGPFTAVLGTGDPASGSGVFAYQDSSIGTSVITLDLWAESEGSYDWETGLWQLGSAETASEFVCRFNLTTSVPYNAIAYVHETDNYDNWGASDISLHNLDTGSYPFSWDGLMHSHESASGILDPGTYELKAVAIAPVGIQGGGNSARTQLTLTLPEPATVLLLLPALGLVRRRSLSC